MLFYFWADVENDGPTYIKTILGQRLVFAGTCWANFVVAVDVVVRIVFLFLVIMIYFLPVK